MGTSTFSCTILQMLADTGYNVIGVVSQPDKPVGRKRVLQMTPVKELATSLGIPVYQPISLKNDASLLDGVNFDIIITCAYGQIIPKSLLAKPRLGCINVHASLLPKYRGGAPIQYAILKGEAESGISIMKTVFKMDAGPVYRQVTVDINDSDTYSILHDRLAIAGAKLLNASLPAIFNETAVFIDQDESQVSFAWNITKEDEHIHFNQEVKTVYNQIRALLDKPAGFFLVSSKKIKIHEATYERCETLQPGQVLGLDNHQIVIAANNGVIRISRIQMEGKSVTDAASFWSGYHTFMENKICD